jgi:hypothetical protein
MNRLYLVDQALPEKPDFPLLIFAVEKEAQETDTQIQSLSVTKISVKAGEEVQPKAAPVSFFDFNLILTGDYQNLKGFLGRMENLRRIVKLDSISFEKAKKTEKELPKIIGHGESQFSSPRDKFMKTKGVSRDLFIISIITVVTVTVWLVLDIYLTYQKKETPQLIKKQMETLNPKLETSVLQELEKKQALELDREDFVSASEDSEKSSSSTESGTP